MGNSEVSVFTEPSRCKEFFTWGILRRRCIVDMLLTIIITIFLGTATYWLEIRARKLQ